MWTSDEALSILRMDTQIFVDATFRVTPAPFSQCLIIMAFDPSTNLYVPCVWALMTAKCEYLYCEVLHSVIVALKYHWSPKVVVVDFEKALLNSIKYQFPKSKIVGCYFHFRQALHRKMTKLSIQSERVSIALNELKGLLAINEDDVFQEVARIETHIELQGAAFSNFWAYFRNTWLVRFPPTLWRNNNDDITLNGARTNNCLERYNRRLGDKFLNAHPNIFSFIAAIQEEEHYYSNLVRGIRSGSIAYAVEFD
jgi:hypothetical protein